MSSARPTKSAHAPCHCALIRDERAASTTGDKDRKPSICFVAHNAYGALAGVDTGHTGGIERQQALMARWLAAHGYRVAMVTADDGQSDDTMIDGVRVIKTCPRNAGLKFMRFIHPKWTSLYRALRQADADVYYYNCGDLGLGQVAWWCRWHGRKCVYSVASDPDCDPRLPALQPLRERVLYRYGVRHAHHIVAQTRRQQASLSDGFNVPATVVPLPCATPWGGVGVSPALGGVGVSPASLDGAPVARATPPNGRVPRVLWVGRFSPEKRLEWLLDLAERCHQYQFDVVGAANSDSPESAALVERARTLPNVRLHGRVVHARMSDFYRQAAALCCTSAYEGFPNTFLEAWSHGLPIVSTFDPDDLLAQRELGLVATTLPGLAAALEDVFTSPGRWQQLADKGRRYCADNHTLDAVMSRFETVFREVVAGPHRT